jgi:hypothetical protein
MRSAFVSKGEAVVVADVLGTVAELRQASAAAVRLRSVADQAKGGALLEHNAAEQAEDYVRELTARIAGRAARDDMEPNEAIRLAERVLDGKLRLPEGVETLEAA